MSNKVDKYDLNKNWGVPFDIESAIEKKFEEEFSSGIWLCIQELVYLYRSKDTAYSILSSAGFTREECIKCQECSGSWDDEMNEFIEQYFV